MQKKSQYSEIRSWHAELICNATEIKNITYREKIYTYS